MAGGRAVFLLAAGLAVMTANPFAAAAEAPARRSAPAPSIDGSWAGQFLGSTFTFEFRPVGAKFAGRYRSAQYGKWHNLNNLSVAGPNVRFEFSSTPAIVVSLKRTDPRTLAGVADVSAGAGAGASKIPLTLTRTP